MTQQWAAHFYDRRFGGIRYAARFAPSAGPNAIALFGDAGGRDWTADLTPIPGRIATASAGINVTLPPHSETVRITDPRHESTTKGPRSRRIAAQACSSR